MTVDPAMIAAISGLITTVGVLVVGVMTAWNNAQATRRTRAIETLERNTNSIKDALVEMAGRLGEAKGRADLIEEQRKENR